MSGGLAVEFDRPDRTYRAGEVVRGRVVVPAEAGDGLERVTLTRRWKTHGKGNPTKGEELELVLHRGPLDGQGPWELPFEVATPAGPFTYRGELLNVDHYLRATLDVPWAFDPKVEEEFVLVPGADAGPPSPALYRAKEAGKASERAGCRRGLGVFLLFLGFVTIPFGLVLMAVGLFVLVPDLWKRIAARRVGDVSAGLDRRLVPPGEAASLRVRIRPPGEARIDSVVAVLRGREVCVSGTGTDRRTHSHVFHERSARLSGPRTLAARERVTLDVELPVPDTGPYSFSVSDNEIRWDIVVQVDMPSWPDWKEELPIVVWPAPARRAAAPRAGADVTIESPPPPPQLPGPRPATPTSSPASSVPPPSRPAPSPPSPTRIEAEPAPPPEPEPGPTPAPDPVETGPPPGSGERAEPVADDPADAAASGLAGAVRALMAEPSYGGGRGVRIDELVGSRHAFELEVERVERSFGAWSEEAFREGRTVLGTVADTAVPVAVRFPSSLNPEIDALARGDRRPVEGEVVEWQRLDRRPLLHADG